MIVYQDLTFPEVEDLPRHLPLVLPLGRPASGALEAAFQDLENWVLLPELPYGHQEPVLCPSWRALVSSLLDTLAEDGFRRVILAGPGELPGGWEQRRVEDQPLPITARPLALVPLGHTEQHGFHLPLSTDTVIIEALASRAAERLPACWRLPVLPYGVSMHRREFPGTLTVSPRVFEDFLTELCGRLIGLGCEALYLVNGHGGNHSFLVNVVKFAGERWPQAFTATSFLHTSSGAALERLLAERGASLMGHACELETSYMLALRPELVHLERAVDEPDFGATQDYQMDWVEEGALIANPPWSDDTATGSYGWPSLATAEKGARWLAVAAKEMARLASQVLEQQHLRADRRQQGWRPGAWRARLPAQNR